MIERAEPSLACTLAPSPNCGERRGGRKPDMLVLHYTGMPTADGALEWLCSQESQVSSHYFVFEDGRISQLVAERERAWHAGVSCWAGERDINSCSIGIEIAYPGPRNGSDFAGAPDFPAAQLQAVAALCRDIVDRNDIPPQRILAHSDVAPARKIDPGDRFDWAFLSGNGIGLWAADRKKPGEILLAMGCEGEDVLTLQHGLAALGYCLNANGVFDEATKLVVTALQRHYRQERVDGCVDRSTSGILKDLLERMRAIVAAK